MRTARSYGGRSELERRAERRQKLLDAGLELFGTCGYAATTIESLCAQARLNARYFYAEFGTKEALLRAVYDRHVEAVFIDVAAALGGSGPGLRERLGDGLGAFIGGTLADRRAARVNYFEIVGVSSKLESHRRAVLRRYAELVTEEIRRGWHEGDDAQAPALAAAVLAADRTVTQAPPAGPAPETVPLHMTAVALVSATDGLIIDALTGEAPVDADAIVQTLLALFMGTTG